MNEGMERKLTLVSAPAGFGKTTLLSQWARDTDITVLWVSLDPADNDLNRFLTYCVAALQTLQAHIGEVTLGALQAPQTPAIGSLLTPLINDVSKSSDPFALVLDDYHVIEEQPVHAALTFLLGNLPNHAHVVVAGRADPPFPLAHMRALGQLYEIRAADLRFTVDEAFALLDQATDSSVSAEDVAALEARTEGWAAGLQLAAISMRGSQDISEFVQAFTGSHRFVVDYLVEEVLDQQPESPQEFLLATSILERLTAPLCDAVTGESESQAILTRLEQANLFVVPLDDERRWYRYHHLFAELLRHRLGQTDPEHVPELHRRASVWYEENDSPEEAIHHAIRGGHFRRAAQLTEVNGKELMARSEIGIVKRWIEALPEEWVRARPQLGSLYGRVLALTNQLDRVEPYLQAAEEAIHATPPQPDLSEAWELDDPERAKAVVQGSVATCRAIVARARGDGLHMVELLRRALAQYPADELSGRCVAYLYLGFALWMTGDVQRARQNLEKSNQAAQASGQTYTAMSSLGALGRLLIELGELHQSQRIHQRAFQLAERHIQQTGKPLPAITEAHWGLGTLSYERNALTLARGYVETVIEATRPLGVTEWLLNAYVALARIQRAQREVEGALATMQTAASLVEPPEASDVLRAEVAAHQAQLWITLGNERPKHLMAASRWAKEAGLSASDEPVYARELEYLTLARLTLAQGDPVHAVALLDRMLDASESAGRKGKMIEILVLQALAHQAQGDISKGLTRLERALALAEPEGYVRTFVDEGEPMRTLLTRLAERGVKYSYAQRLLAAFDESPPMGTTGPPRALPERLTQREVEVLRLISAGLTNQEIGTQLVISVVTVKRHISNLFGKLGVANRTMAAARASELGLL